MASCEALDGHPVDLVAPDADVAQHVVGQGVEVAARRVARRLRIAEPHAKGAVQVPMQGRSGCRQGVSVMGPSFDAGGQC